MDIIGMIKSGFDLVASIFKHQTHRSELNNAPDVRRRTVAQKEEAAQAETVQAVEQRKLDDLRKQASE